MSKYRLISMLFYGVAALIGTVLPFMMTIAAVLAVGLPFAVAAAADRFVNRDAEPDERMRSFVLYALGAIAGLLVILVFGSQLGSWAPLALLAGFGAFALLDYLKPPAEYTPRDPHRYGESPPVTIR
jgi:hypothetical protein